MGTTEAVRLAVVHEAVAGRITVREGMRRTGLSRRQFLRYKRRYRDQGPPGLLHGNRGRVSPRRIDEELRLRIVGLLDQPVALNDRHIRDLLSEDDLTVCAETVRRIRLELGRPPKQHRRPRRYRLRRDRSAQIGAMVLIDGSPFRWLGPAQPECTLVGGVDDATGQILGLIVRDEEDLHGYTELLQHLLVTHGVPWTLYGDRAAILVRNDHHWTVEEELEGRQRPSHVGLMLEELGIRYIAALSPQAKGRIERLWRTLQDRLAAELQLRGITDRAGLIAFLPDFIQRFNRTFAQPAQSAVAVWRHAPAKLGPILACRYLRVVAPDNTVSFGGERLAIPPGPGRRSYARCQVEVREQLDGRCVVLFNGHCIAERAAPAGPFRLQPRGSARSRRSSREPARPVRQAPTANPRSADQPRPKPGKAWRRGSQYRLGERKEARSGVS
jgi:transposase